MVSIVCVSISIACLLWSVYNVGKIVGYKEGINLCQRVAEHARTVAKNSRDFGKTGNCCNEH